ncbi:MAG TPA: SRPBCC family protein [Candidatus Paceibacterota bacterium]|nr:SRPBCC family protein [Candidatus Paceibacterota bacterium]
MKDLKLTVRIKRPIADVFEFTTNPSNTSKWIDSVAGERADSFPPKIGTMYENWDSARKITEYRVSRYEPNAVFQLDATKQDYKVRYTYTPISENETELEYYEWSESDKLHAPFMQEILDTLKEVMEAEKI